MNSEWDGQERRMSQDEQLGYIKGKVESVQEELTEFKTDMKALLHEHFTEERESKEELSAKIDKLTFEITVYKRVFQFLLASAGAIIAFLTHDLVDSFIKWFKG